MTGSEPGDSGDPDQLARALGEGLFDRSHYEQQCGLVFDRAEAAWSDYVWRGRFVDVDPSERFDSMGYLNGNRPVYRAGRNPLVHFLEQPSEGHRRFFLDRVDPIPAWSPQQRDPIGAELASAGSLGSTSTEGSMRVALQIHVFHRPEFTNIVRRVAGLAGEFDLLVSTPHEELASLARSELGGLANVGVCDVRVVPNLGRNLGPLLVEFASQVVAYDLVGHIHTKRSRFVDEPHWQWSEYLLEYTVGIPGLVNGIIDRFAREPNLGLVHPISHPMLGATADLWGRNVDVGKQLATRLGHGDIDTNGLVAYPAGAMFWFRPSALAPLFESFSIDDLPPEPVSDGSVLHAIERIFGELCRANGSEQRLVVPRGLVLTSDDSYPARWV